MKPIKVSRRAASTAIRGPQEAEPWKSNSSYARVDLSGHFKDTQVSDVYISKSFLSSTSTLVEKSLESTPVNEVGGFVFGQVAHTAGGYTLLLTELVETGKGAMQSPGQLRFGLEVHELIDDYLSNQPDDTLLGWLHTHPRHSPYLSSQDFTIHVGFFKLPYHIAIVIDPLTENWWSGIYSRRHSGEVNNQVDSIIQFHWKALLS